MEIEILQKIDRKIVFDSINHLPPALDRASIIVVFCPFTLET